MDDRTRCQSCGAESVAAFYHAKNVPVHSCLLLSSRDEALRFPRRDIRLGFCASCGFIENVIFDPHMMRYSLGYEEQQSFSPRFNAFARDLATRLVSRYSLQNKEVIEIGCGKGDFLALLCEMGCHRGFGIDPSYVPDRLKSPGADRITFIRDFYSERYSDLCGDLICCRHTLEHIHDPREFVGTVKRTVGNRAKTVVFFEVPDILRVLLETAFWDIYYEHCSYFSLGSLARLFRSCGFEILDLAKDFDGQYLLVEAQPANGAARRLHPAENDLDQVMEAVRYFAKNYQAKLDEWNAYVDRIQRDGRQAVIWGSSSKCVSFVTSLNIRDEIEFVVDINPHRQGKFLPGNGQKIVPPEFLKDYRPDAVILMNPVYATEVQAQLARMGLNPEVVAV
ncbi:MAG: class I SAM-dependent methyltransferase [Terriglobia bacterium]